MSTVDRPDAPSTSGMQNTSGVQNSTSGVHNEPIMPIDGRCQVETDDSSGVVRLTGVLDAAEVEAVRDALLARLAAHPGPVTVDVSGLRILGSAGREIFDQVCAEVADWPDAGLLICGPPEAAELVGAPVWPSPAEALAQLPATGAEVGLSIELTPAVGAARQARQLVNDACARWAVPELSDPGCIAVTEMVNNVVAHAQTPMTVRLALDTGALRVAVRDYSHRQPAFTGLAPPTSAGGRGLLLIDTVSRRWGSSLVPDGKVVWAVLFPEDETPY